ncbi:MAG: hypothetical protein WCN88_05190 [Candidatus Falkowbacteria bacterium]
MKSGNRYILYIFIIILICAGLALYILRNQAADYLNTTTGMMEVVTPVKLSTSSKDLIDTALFSEPKFLALKNNINKFDFDSICKTSVGQIVTTSTSTSGEIVNTTQTLSCALGNNTPFPLPTKNQ